MNIVCGATSLTALEQHIKQGALSPVAEPTSTVREGLYRRAGGEVVTSANLTIKGLDFLEY